MEYANIQNVGRITIVPKDEFIFGEQYRFLNTVTHNGWLYLAKKDNVDILPTDTEYWMPMLSVANLNIKPEDIGIEYLLKDAKNPNKFWGTDAEGNAYWMELPGIPENVVTEEQLQDYALLSEAGFSLVLHVDPQTYVMEIQLKNKGGEVISYQDFDFPIETAFTNVEYDKEKHEIIFTLQNGTKTDPINISDIVRGLVPDSRMIAGLSLKEDITVEQLKNALGVNDLDIIETTEELEANIDSGKVVDALVVKEMNDSIGIDTKIINGVPNWSPRGADTWIPFRNNSDFKVKGIGAKYFSVSKDGSTSGSISIPAGVDKILVVRDSLFTYNGASSTFVVSNAIEQIDLGSVDNGGNPKTAISLYMYKLNPVGGTISITVKGKDPTTGYIQYIMVGVFSIE